MHYVLSDIHGQYDRFLRMMDKIKISESDTLYVIGDVIDRGPKGGEALLDILTMKNAVLLLGNHEHMMINAYCNRGDERQWLRNGADSTINNILETNIAPLEFIKALQDCPVIVRENIEDNEYYFVHACPLDIGDKRLVKMNEITVGQVEWAVWTRIFDSDSDDNDYAEKIFDLYPETTFFIGHTPVYYCSYGIIKDNIPHISPAFGGKVINLDCGCARNLALGCLCIETKEEFYT